MMKLTRLGPALLAAAALVADQASAERLTFDAIFDHDTQTAPQQIEWGPEGHRLTYVWKDDSGKALWMQGVEGGPRKRLLTIGEGAEPAIAKLDAYHWAPGGQRLLLESEGDLYLFTLAGGELTRLTETEAKEQIPHFSPDDSRIAYVSDWDLWLLEIESGKVTRLTEGGKKDESLNGIADWVYWEEIWDRTTTGFWWSPDGKRIAYYHFDESRVESYPMVDFTTGYPEVEWQKYPKAGETNPVVRVGVIDVASRETVWLGTGDDPDVYLGRIDWLPGASRVAVQRLNRDQNQLDILSCSAEAGECTTLHQETSDTWVNLTHDLTFLDDGSFLWTSEASGWNRLSLHDASGERSRRLSPEGWNVTGVDGLAGEAVIYTAYSTEPLGARHRTVFIQPLGGGAPKRLSPEGVWASARPSPTGGHFVLTLGSTGMPTTMDIRSTGQLRIVGLPTVAPPGVDSTTFPERRFLTIPGPEGSRLPAMLMTPPDLDAEGSYPAIMYHYGGPASQVVADRWSWRSRALWHLMMAQRGYVVMMVDNRASNYFGKHGNDRAHRRFGPENLAAQRAGVEYLGSLGYVDLERVGIWGGSGGGYHTLYALTNSPGTWAAGVAFAPVSDFRLYDTIWTERYLDHPDDNPDGYRDSATTTYAADLADELLMVHGTADDNVHPQNTLLMAKELIAAGKQFEMSIHPRQKHGFRGNDSRHFYERMTAFFDRHLGR